MGRKGIRRRKKRRRTDMRTEEPPSDAIEDLIDQANWSSYTQNIPRAGDPHREGLRLHRGYGAMTNPRGRPLLYVALAVFVALGVASLLGWVIR